MRSFRCIAALVTMACLMGCTAPATLAPSPTPAPTLPEPISLHLLAPESVLPVLRTAAASFHERTPAIEVRVSQRADSLIPSALAAGDADLAVVTWLPSPIPDSVWVSPLARDALAIVVHPQNGLPGITLEQLQQLFQGRTEDWANWGGLPGAPRLISREEGSGEYSFFQSWVMRDVPVSLNALLAPNSETVLRYVSEAQLAVGYVSAIWVDGRVRAVAVDGVPPSREAVAANVYPLTRTVFVMTEGEPSGAAREFIQWLLGSEGRDIVRLHGLEPVQSE